MLLVPALSLLLLTASPPPPLPSVAVLTLEAKQGVSRDVTDMLTSNLVAQLRATKRFSRVVGTAEIGSLLGYERQKQLMSCDTTSCMSEVADALGVDFLVTGSVGRLGEAWLFNVTLLNARNGLIEGTVSRPVRGKSEDVLLTAIPLVLADVLRDADLTVKRAGAPATLAPTPAPAPAVAAPTQEAPARRSPLPGVARGVGAAGLGVGVLGVLGAGVLAAAVAGTGAVLVGSQARVPLRGLYPVAALAGAGVAVLGGVVAVLSAGAGAAALGASLVL